MDLPEIVPIFPLPDHVLLPFLPTPYRLFEPASVAMAQALLEKERSSRWIVVPRLESFLEGEVGGSTPIAEIAVAACVHQVLPLAGDQYLMLAEGRARVRLTEAESDLAYRLAWVTLVPDEEDFDGDLDPSDVLRLATLLVGREGGPNLTVGGLTADRPDPAVLSWRVAGAYLRDADQRQEMLGLTTARARLERLEELLTALLARSARRNGGPPE